MTAPAISVCNVTKVFRVPHERYLSLRTSALHAFKSRTYSTLRAVDGVSFEVARGEFFGIVGRNGSGKSTLLKLLAGIYLPTTGTISMTGSLSPFIELGVGFNPELTARENVFLNGVILGLTRAEITARFDDIIAFGELEEFVDQKLKNFSSGMQVRLAFSIAVQAHSEILLVDEVLAVGDANFQTKCFELFRSLKRDGKTIVFVSHDMAAIRDFCDRAILIENGRTLIAGTPEAVTTEYIRINLSQANRATLDAGESDGSRRWGTGEATIANVITTADGEPRAVFGSRHAIAIVIEVTAKENIKDPVIGVVIKDAAGHALCATNTKLTGTQTGEWTPGSTHRLTCIIDNIFGNGSYTVSPAVATTDTRSYYDWIEDAISFRVQGREMAGGFIQPNTEFRLG